MEKRELARILVEQSAVLLKNEGGTLPFPAGQKAAFFGRGQLCTVFSGSGSGASRGECRETFLSACEDRGILAEPGLKAFYSEYISAEPNDGPELDAEAIRASVACGDMYEIFGKYHPPRPECGVPQERLSDAVAFTDTAILILSRESGGEECDRHLEDDYLLTPPEQDLVAQVCGNFRRVVLVLNINGLIDLAWTERYPSIRSILFLGLCGEEGPAALANLLTGWANPSGKLAVTIASHFEDYPSAEHFSWDKEHPETLLTYVSYGLDAAANGSVGFVKSPVTVYWEGVYNGYRYFDTFGKEPLYPFGFGLSYTSFDIASIDSIRSEDGLTVSVCVENTGGTAGREVVQLYLSALGTTSERPARELKGFAKTPLLAPGENASLEISIPWRELACYSEEQAAWVIEAGQYAFFIGTSSRTLTLAAVVDVDHDLLVRQCRNRLGLRACNRSKLKFLHRRSRQIEHTEGSVPHFILDFIAPETAPALSASPVPKNLTLEELASLCVGFGPGIPFSAFSDGENPSAIQGPNGRPLTVSDHPAGVPGYVSPAMPERGIHSIYYKDGPSSVEGVAWPTAMLLACSFDRELWRAFGDAIGGECQDRQVDVWLAPAVNLHRNPLCGRNFEYFSEDPFLTGVCACEITGGVQENHPVLVCPKHFAVNEQETFRRGSSKRQYDAADSILTERTARELYLKPFEMLVKEAGIACIMTSFNKINGTFAGGSKDLCTHVLREEWGFDGVVVTDWGDMDIVVDGGDAIAAGNDVVMPGGPPVIAQILRAYQEGHVTMEQLEIAVGRLLRTLRKTTRRSL